MARRGRTRTLRPDEQALWAQVQRSAHPLHPAPRPAPEDPPPAPVKAAPPPPRVSVPSDFRIGAAAREGVATALPAAPALRMDARTFGKLKRGKVEVEARLDLHGLTLAEAHPRLIGFVHSSHAAGRRLVLVITGKGRDRDGDGPIPARRGLLRHQVPVWLSGGTLAPLVLQVVPAHRRHGGGGAYYVYLRR
ncbi:smr domain protein [Oceaniovalibus guishaninsula JLT2003]|uniref:Smr domain protein n=1 Tax=Oceaniovalibus guishaninsula JLT2003 TaxID=1231392 RepID=K2GPW6_9RHOB|nr:Smr/MutS family protein [Oceaniovalibus guishaninsula]EKE44681.1 smr domain protein [Oceaniovalibus guishaninsula JLT2003]